MSAPTFELADPTDPELVTFLTSSTWPFHLQVRHTPESVANNVARGAYAAPDNEPHWIVCEGERVGLVVLNDLEDPTPVFDLRLAEGARGRGVGVQVLAWLAERVFRHHGKPRLEGHTRADNLPMRKVFRRAGWQQEAHYRRAWPDQAGNWHDATAYAILREEWAGGAPVPVPALDGLAEPHACKGLGR